MICGSFSSTTFKKLVAYDRTLRNLQSVLRASDLPATVGLASETVKTITGIVDRNGKMLIADAVPFDVITPSSVWCRHHTVMSPRFD